MKNTLKLVGMAALAAIGIGNAHAQIPVTDVAGITAEALNSGNEIAQMALEYDEALKQVQMMETATKVLDTSKFGNSLSALEKYKSAYDMTKSAKGINSMESATDMLGKMGRSGASANREYVRRLDSATNSKYELTKQSSNLAAARMNSVESDKAMMTNLQNANGQAEGQMQAQQVGNQINSETLGQLVKMREEAAMTAQMQADQRRIELEEEAARKAAWEAEKARGDSSVQSTSGQSYAD